MVMDCPVGSVRCHVHADSRRRHTTGAGGGPVEVMFRSGCSLIPGASPGRIRVPVAAGAPARTPAHARFAVDRCPGRSPQPMGPIGRDPASAVKCSPSRRLTVMTVPGDSYLVMAAASGMPGPYRQAVLPSRVPTGHDHRAEQAVSAGERPLRIVIGRAAAYRIVVNVPPTTRELWYIEESAIATARLCSINAKRRIGRTPRAGLPLEGRPQR